MMPSIDRRDFLAASAALTAGLLTADRLEAATPKRAIKKATIGNITPEKLAGWKAAGFEGVESKDRAATPEQAEAMRRQAEAAGLAIHSIMFGWANFNKPKSFEADLAAVENCLRAAQVMGANTVLMVPARIDVAKTPRPWEFDIDFDPANEHLKRVVKGDNAPYAEYMAAHDHAIDTSREAIRKLIPVAEKCGVVIAVENVWNNLLVKPAIFANFVRSFDNPWVQAYFDIGNHLVYQAPQDWIMELDKLIVKLHAKDCKFAPDGHNVAFAEILDGDVNWPAVVKAIDTVGYSGGWLTIEGAKLPPKEQAARMDKIIAMNPE